MHAARAGPCQRRQRLAGHSAVERTSSVWSPVAPRSRQQPRQRQTRPFRRCRISAHPAGGTWHGLAWQGCRGGAYTALCRAAASHRAAPGPPAASVVDGAACCCRGAPPRVGRGPPLQRRRRRQCKQAQGCARPTSRCPPAAPTPSAALLPEQLWLAQTAGWRAGTARWRCPPAALPPPAAPPVGRRRRRRQLKPPACDLAVDAPNERSLFLLCTTAGDEQPWSASAGTTVRTRPTCAAASSCGAKAGTRGASSTRWAPWPCGCGGMASMCRAWC